MLKGGLEDGRSPRLVQITYLLLPENVSGISGVEQPIDSTDQNKPRQSRVTPLPAIAL